MNYSAAEEKTFQQLRKEREQHVRALRSTLEKAGVREYANTTPTSLQGGVLGLPPSQQRVFDIENVIANAAGIRQALAVFDSAEAAKNIAVADLPSWRNAE